MLFDRNVNFEAQLENALREAKETGKRIIVEFGGDWCSWSVKMCKVLESAKFKSLLQERFIFLRCYAGHDGECHYPEHLEFPNFSAIPFFVLLNENGEIIASQSTETFEWFRFYKKYKIYSFLKSWAKK